MAQLEKQGARRPRIDKGYSHVSCGYKNEDHPRGTMPPMEYKLTVSATDVRGIAYTAILSEDEMLLAITEWMKMLTNNRERERVDEAKRRKLSA